MVGILGGEDPGLLKRGKESHKYFARNGRLYERNPVRARGQLCRRWVPGFKAKVEDLSHTKRDLEFEVLYMLYTGIYIYI